MTFDAAIAREMQPVMEETSEDTCAPEPYIPAVTSDAPEPEEVNTQGHIAPWIAELNTIAENVAEVDSPAPAISSSPTPHLPRAESAALAMQGVKALGVSHQPSSRAVVGLIPPRFVAMYL